MWVAWLWKLLRNKRFRAWLLATAGPRAIALFLVWIERVRHRQVAIGEARQVDGMFSAAVIDGERHVVVWKDGEPISAYPPVEGDLAAKLRTHARRDLTRPEDLPTHRARRWASEAARRLRGGAQSVGEHARGGAHGVSRAAREGTHHLGEGAHAIRQLLPGRGGDDEGARGDAERAGGSGG